MPTENNGPNSSVYAGMSDETAAFAFEAAKSINALVDFQVDTILQMGKELAAVREKLQHGQFTEWVGSELPISLRTAENYMNVANRLGSDFQTVANFPSTVAYALAAKSVPDELRDEVLTYVREKPDASSKVVFELLRRKKGLVRDAKYSDLVENAPKHQKPQAFQAALAHRVQKEMKFLDSSMRADEALFDVLFEIAGERIKDLPYYFREAGYKNIATHIEARLGER